jgi:2-polyprenyl-3-methyl-5-hydroxy-6-metoxy-1,4-benzoquinol methylase
MKKPIQNPNPIIKEFNSLGLINENNLEIINYKTRDSNQKVFRDKVSGVIVLENYLTDGSYYAENTSASNEDMYFDEHGYFYDDFVRVAEHSKIIQKAVSIVDVGCEWGGFINILSKNKPSVIGVEPNSKCQDFIKNNLKLNCISDINDMDNESFDLITLFHVLEHIPNQVDFLKTLRKSITSNGKLIIEVPHAKDMLLTGKSLQEYKDFIFWTEHLVLHTMDSLKSVLTHSGFSVSSQIYKQRYGFANHIEWMMNAMPGGHEKRKDLNGTDLDEVYKKWICSIGMTDTIVIIAEPV